MLQKRESFTLNQIAELDAFCILILIKDAKGGFWNHLFKDLLLRCTKDDNHIIGNLFPQLKNAFWHGFYS